MLKVRIPAPEKRPGIIPSIFRRYAAARDDCHGPFVQSATVIADEPTTALDATIQAQILELMNEMQRETGAAIILITHDLGVVAEVQERARDVRRKSSNTDGERHLHQSEDAAYAGPARVTAAPRCKSASVCCRSKANHRICLNMPPDARLRHDAIAA